MARSIKEADSGARGADHTSMGKYERDESEPGVRWLAAFCQVTRANANWLLLGEGPMLRRDATKLEMLADKMAGLLDDLD